MFQKLWKCYVVGSVFRMTSTKTLKTIYFACFQSVIKVWNKFLLSSSPSFTSSAFKKKRQDLFWPHLIVFSKVFQIVVFSKVFQIVFVHLAYNLFLVSYSLCNWKVIELCWVQNLKIHVRACVRNCICSALIRCIYAPCPYSVRGISNV
jgi:hypothetical protein